MYRRTIEIAAFVAVVLLAALSFHSWLAAHDDQLRLQSTLASQKQLIDAADARERTRDEAFNTTLAEIDKLKRASQTPEQIVTSLQRYLALPQPLALSANPAVSTSSQPSVERLDQKGTTPSEFRRAGPKNDTPLKATPPNTDYPDLPDAPTPRPGNSPLDQPSCRAAICIPVPPVHGDPTHAAASSDQNSPLPLPLPNFPPLRPTCTNSPACSAEIPAADLKPLYNYVQDCRACQAELAAARQNTSDDASKIAALTRERDAAITAAKGGPFWRRLRRNILWLSVGAALGYFAASR